MLQIIGAKPFQSQATEWGKRNESTALKKYKETQHDNGHHGLYYSPSGFVISEKYPYLGVSPDAVVHDPTEENPFGLTEVKCPFSHKNQTLLQAAESRDFCSVVELNLSGMQTMKLKRSHSYFCQVQGQMAITGRCRCDFVTYTERGINVERIHYDEDFWNNELLPKL